MTPENSVLVDKISLEEQFLQCHVCNEKFDPKKRPPKLLPCNHTFCLPCLLGIFEHDKNTTDEEFSEEEENLCLKCPTCRSELLLSKDKIQELPTDHRVIQLIDFFSQTYTATKNVCFNHYRQPLSFFCKECSTPVCRDCTIVSHNKSEGHTIIELSEAMVENSTLINDIEKHANDNLQQMQTRSDALSNALERLTLVEDEKQRQIKKKFFEYHDVLNQREAALSTTVHQMVKDQRAKIQAQKDSIKEEMAQLKKAKDEFTSAINANDVRKLFSMTLKMKGNETKYKDVAVVDDNELLQSCQFVAKNEDAFFCDMMELGEILSKQDTTLVEPIKLISAFNIGDFDILDD